MILHSAKMVRFYGRHVLVVDLVRAILQTNLRAYSINYRGSCFHQLTTLLVEGKSVRQIKLRLLNLLTS